MYAFIVLLAAVAPPQVPVPPQAPAVAEPVKTCACPVCTCEPRCLCTGGKCLCPACGLASYADVYARVQKGETIVVYNGVAKPKDAKGVAVPLVKGWDAGVYRCFPDAKGNPVNEPLREVSATVPFVGTPATIQGTSAQRAVPLSSVSPGGTGTARITTPVLGAVRFGGTDAACISGKG